MIEPGTLVVTVNDRQTPIALVGGGSWTLPVGVATLVEGELEGADRLAPEQLTNALGIVADHLDDVLRDSPIVAASPSVVAVGRHATVLARVELGSDIVPDDYVLDRADADEVFRTLVAERADERRHNPGLDPADVHSVIGTCCVVLAVMRRLDISSIGVRESIDLGAES